MISFKRLEVIEFAQLIFYAVVLIQLVLINYVYLYIEDLSTVIRSQQSFICLSCYGIIGAFGSAEWITGASSRLVFVVAQTTMIQFRKAAEDYDGSFMVYLHSIFVLILYTFGEVHFYLITRQ